MKEVHVQHTQNRGSLRAVQTVPQMVDIFKDVGGGGGVGGTLADGRASFEKLLTSSNDAVLCGGPKSAVDCS